MGIPFNHAPASATAATKTLSAVESSTTTNACVEIEMLMWSLDVTPAAAVNLKIDSPSGTTIFSLDITAAGAGFIPFSGSCFRGAPGQAMVITLASGGVGVTGKINGLQR